MNRLSFVKNLLCSIIAFTFLPISSALAEEIQPPLVAAPQGGVPSDAINLLGDEWLLQWSHLDGRPVEWAFSNGILTVKPHSGSIMTKREFRSMQIHLEFATPDSIEGEGQGRGNSGAFIHGMYEVQILDSFNNDTWPKAMCGAVCGQYPPLVNASRAPGEWQSYDILFHAPVFDELGNVTKRATITVLHNGVLIHDHVEICPTRWGIRDGLPQFDDRGILHPAEKPSGGPLMIQDHRNPIRFRSIWIRELPEK